MAGVEEISEGIGLEKSSSIKNLADQQMRLCWLWVSVFHILPEAEGPFDQWPLPSR